MKPQEIIDFAKQCKKKWHTNDPYVIAEKFGISVNHVPSSLRDFTAHTVKFAGYPTMISINDRYDEFSRKLLCAHELAHAIFHTGSINYFAVTGENMTTNVEYEANLFALALLFDDRINSRLTVPLDKMSNYLLKSIIELNLKKIE